MKSLVVNTVKSFEISKALNNWSMRRRKLEGVIQQGECFRDAIDVLVHLNGQGYYVEGWGVSSIGFPVEHAWVVFHHEVIDVTWEADDLGECKYYPTIAVSFNRITNSGGYSTPLVYDRKALKRLGMSPLMVQETHQAHLYKLIEMK